MIQGFLRVFLHLIMMIMIGTLIIYDYDNFQQSFANVDRWITRVYKMHIYIYWIAYQVESTPTTNQTGIDS